MEWYCHHLNRHQKKQGELANDYGEVKLEEPPEVDLESHATNRRNDPSELDSVHELQARLHDDVSDKELCIDRRDKFCRGSS